MICNIFMFIFDQTSFLEVTSCLFGPILSLSASTYGRVSPGTNNMPETMQSWLSKPTWLSKVIFRSTTDQPTSMFTEENSSSTSKGNNYPIWSISYIVQFIIILITFVFWIIRAQKFKIIIWSITFFAFRFDFLYNSLRMVFKLIIF